MISTYAGLFIAGIFTLLPGRIIANYLGFKIYNLQNFNYTLKSKSSSRTLLVSSDSAMNFAMNLLNKWVLV